MPPEGVDARVLIDSDEEELVARPEAMSSHMHAQTTKCSRRCTAGPVLVLFVVALVGGFGFHRGSVQSQAASAVTTATARITLSANTSADPCTDLWEFACGTFESNTEHGASSLSVFQATVDTRLKRRLEAGTTTVSAYYLNCLGSPAPSFNCTVLEAWQAGETVHDVAFGSVLLPGASRLTPALVYGEVVFADHAIIPAPGASDCEMQLITLASEVAGMHVRSLAVFGDNATLCTALAAINASTEQMVWTLPASSSGCLLETLRLWPGEMAGLFLDEYPLANSPAVQTAAMTMVDEIQTVFVERLRAAHFDALADKIAAVKAYVEYVPQQDAPTAVHDALQFAADYKRINIERAQDEMQASVANAAWDMAASSINAYYSPMQNTLHVTPAMLLYASEGGGSHALEHGKLGFVIAHELAHAIDNTGVQFDVKGIMANIMPDEYNQAVFAGGVQCLQAEFATDGQTTGEDIADHIAMQVMKDVMQRRVPSPAVHVCAPVCTELSSMMLFYMNFAETWCAAADTIVSATDVHSPGKVRVKHAFVSADAPEAFGCPASTRNKCVIAGF